MVSIRQNAYPDVLPDFRNLGVIARVLIAVNAAVLAGALFAAPDLVQALRALRAGRRAGSSRCCSLIVTLLFALSPLLARLPYWAGCAAVVALVMALAAGYLTAVAELLDQPVPGLLRYAAAVRAARRRAARLPAPARQGAFAGARRSAPAGAAGAHPAALPVQQPERGAGADPPRPAARRALARGPGGPVSHADVGRAPVRAPRRRDLAARALRRDRAAAPGRAAAHHLGPRRRARPTRCCRRSCCSRCSRTPCTTASSRAPAAPTSWCASSGAASACWRRSRIRISRRRVQRAGNRMALENIRERLQLFFDAEARIAIKAADGRYRVELEIPYKSPTDMSELKVFIADDEEPARERLKDPARRHRGRAADASRRRGAQRRARRSSCCRRAARRCCCSTSRCRAWAASRWRATWPGWSSRRASSSSPRTTATRWRPSS